MNIIVLDDLSEENNKLIIILEKLYPHSCIYKACSFGEMFAAADCGRIDVIFSKVCIDGEDPYDSLARLKVLFPRLNVIFFSDSSDYMSRALFFHASGYITGPVNEENVTEQMNNLLYPSAVEIFTFGNFFVYVNGREVKFKRSKSREALAFLVDKKTPCTKKQIAACIFEDHVYDRSYQKYTDNVLRALAVDLKKAGAEELVIHSGNSYCINRNACICDYYEFLNGNTNLFNEEYMSQYSWAEETLASIRYKAKG